MNDTMNLGRDSLTAMDWVTSIAGAALLAVVSGISFAAVIWALSMMLGLPYYVMLGLEGLAGIGAIVIGVWATGQSLQYLRTHR